MTDRMVILSLFLTETFPMVPRQVPWEQIKTLHSFGMLTNINSPTILNLQFTQQFIDDVRKIRDDLLAFK